MRNKTQKYIQTIHNIDNSKKKHTQRTWIQTFKSYETKKFNTKHQNTHWPWNKLWNNSNSNHNDNNFNNNNMHECMLHRKPPANGYYIFFRAVEVDARMRTSIPGGPDIKDGIWTHGPKPAVVRTICTLNRSNNNNNMSKTIGFPKAVDISKATGFSKIIGCHGTMTAHIQTHSNTNNHQQYGSKLFLFKTPNAPIDNRWICQSRCNCQVYKFIVCRIAVLDND